MAKSWKPDEQFEQYAKFIAEHPNYRGMPDLYWDENNKHIQWEAPSNRGSGKFQHSHTKRLNWWKEKAKQIRIDPETTNEWISKTAKQIHPTNKKPCKVCGRVMDIRYAYPSRYLIDRLRKLDYVDEEYPLEGLEHITDLVSRLVEDFGKEVFEDLPKVLKAKGIKIPNIEPVLDSWLNWIEEEYIPKEPSILSPGAMSNAPDRLDGFHTYNRCCRPTADKGRHKENLKTYTTDRRVFEYWNEGNWVAANKLMGLVKTRFHNEECLNGCQTKASADHIGPLSLGFAHIPIFQLLCPACNSAKGNRMMLRDVSYLKKLETEGVKVTSWYAKPLWDMKKNEIDSTEKALRLSKLMRDNWQNAAYLLGRLAEDGYYLFLISLIELEHADFKYRFKGLEIKNHYTRFDKLIKEKKETKYVIEQKARAIRVGLESLLSYSQKDNRNTYLVQKKELEGYVSKIEKVLDKTPNFAKNINLKLEDLLTNFDTRNTESGYREVVKQLPHNHPATFTKAKKILNEAINKVANKLNKEWESARYVRT